MASLRGFEFLTVQQEQEEQEPPEQLAPQDLQVQGDIQQRIGWLSPQEGRYHSPLRARAGVAGGGVNNAGWDSRRRYRECRSGGLGPAQRRGVQGSSTARRTSRSGVWVRVYGSWTEQRATFGLGIHTTTGSRPAAIGSSEANRAPTRELHGEPRRGGRMDVHELPWSCEWDVESGLGEIVVERVDEKSPRRAAPPLIGQKFGLVMGVGWWVEPGLEYVDYRVEDG
ncbi:hypothetical protein CSOJ01_11253 [Colletotrichum sojae]|uniref:Uncharacterized protein n=1 Tax=Colletotrichum sojae TaxID=2175907 RepID=A0A8H6IYN8_9PEZI|nr:hypothetical protein CSOJ01_11253 [Colletotrichum sojae]